MPDDMTKTDFPSRPAQYTAEWLAGRLEQVGTALQVGTAAEDRDRILRRLGYSSYENYLGRVLWKRIRERIRERDQLTCRRCDEKENRISHEVHHDSYTEEVMKGENDSALFLLCSSCHYKVEFTEAGFPRTVEEKRRVLRDREGALAEKRNAEQMLEFKSQIRTLYGGRCHWCKGDTERLKWNNDGDVYVINFAPDRQMSIWACLNCRSVLDRNKAGQPRSDAEKLKLLGKKAAKLYKRRVPSTSLSITNGFRKLNAMQREGLLNEHLWHEAHLQAKYENEPIEPERLAELKRRYDETKMNGR